jgi:hypothetical protein
MSRLCILICRVDEHDDAQMTELARVDLPAVPAHWSVRPLDLLEAQVAQVGQPLLARLCELAWEDLDARAVDRYVAAQPVGSVVADGYAPLQVASRLGNLELRRQVCAHRDGRPHVIPGNDLLPHHQGLLITRGLQEAACLLPQEVPFATAARLLSWQVGEPQLLSATTLRQLVRLHGERIRSRECSEAVQLLSYPGGGKRLGGVPLECPRRRPGWPAALSAAVEAALADDDRQPPAGMTWADWARVRAAHAAEPTTPVADLRRLGPRVAPGQLVLTLDEVLTPAPGRGQHQELRTACLLSDSRRRYFSGVGLALLRQVHAAVHACHDQSLVVVGDGASWIRTFFRDHLAAFPGAEMVLDWYHLARKCRELAARICPAEAARARLLRRVLRALWGGQVSRARRVLRSIARHGADATAIEEWDTYLQARADWIPNYRRRRQHRQYSGNGLAEKANDRIVVRRQKRRGMQWSVASSDGLAALRTLLLNEGWESYWREGSLMRLAA